ncbi:uncharacterized protein [Clytia hemisphaerica]|uniref:ShKT domain-containing protein n=1 Tax=Clytia hemisphaerica TaxID=252671 RepID=A0A7M5WSL2_9CNID
MQNRTLLALALVLAGIIASEACMPGIYDHGHCNYYVSKNKGAYCKHSWMKMFCQYACGYCKEGAPCEDAGQKCEILAQLGFCDYYHTHQEYMKRACRKSCNFCGNENPGPKE